jgi:hypothetical protein
MPDDYPAWFNDWLRRRMPDTAQQQTAGKQMRRFLESPEWRLVEELLEARKARVMADLQRPGRVPEHVEFAHGHGVIEGCDSIRGAAEAVVRVAEKADGRAERAVEATA